MRRYFPDSGLKFLVTGGAGFVGSHLVQSLLKQENKVRVLDDFSTGREQNLANFTTNLEVIHGSILDQELMAKAMSGIDIVFHLAAIASVQKSLDNPSATHQICATGTLEVLQAAKQAGCKRVIYAGSSSAYGHCPSPVQHEDSPLEPLSPYAAAKIAGELYCLCFAKALQLETVRLRFFNIFGPRQRADSPYSGVIAIFAQAFQKGLVPTIFGDGLQTRDFVHVDDAVQGLLLAGSVPGISGQVFNIGTGLGTSLLDLVQALQSLTGKELAPKFEPGRSGEVLHSRADITKATSQLQYKPSKSFTQGLATLFT